MEVLNNAEINLVVKQFGMSKVLKWYLEDFEDKMVGYRGDHLKLIIYVERDGMEHELQLFVKCMPRFEKWKSDYLKDLGFFDKEYGMLSKLFEQFHNGEGTEKWHPKLYYIREDLFIFEDVTKIGYRMPYFKETMTLDVLKGTVKALARFHAQSFIYEEKRSKEIGKPYRIWGEFSEYLREPPASNNWRDTGRNAVMDYLKEFSKHKSEPDFNKKLDEIMPALYTKAKDLMNPSDKYRNVVVHRDLWSNNIFIKDYEVSEFHALLIDFQTVIYCSPMLDLSSLIYFNTSKACRDTYGNEIIEIYYNSLSKILEEANVNINLVLPRDILMKAYYESLLFGITQASIIVPITCMSRKKKDEIFGDPVRSKRANLISRSEEFIQIAKEDFVYKNRLSELFEEIYERYIFPKQTSGFKGS